MSDASEQSTGTATILGSIEDAIGRTKTAAPAKLNGSFPWKTVIICSVLAAFAVIVGWWILNRNNAELAKLRAEKFNNKVDADDRKVLDQVLVSDRTSAAAKIEAADAIAKADAAVKTLADAEKRYEENRAAIARIQSWRDLE